MSLNDLLQGCPFPLFKFEDIEYVSELGSGANGVVYKAIVNNTNYAVKEYNLYGWEDESKFFNSILYELKVLKKIDKLKYSVNTYGLSYKVYDENIQVLIIMELLVSVGDLFDYTQKDHFWKLFNNEKNEKFVTFYPDEHNQKFIYIMNVHIKKKITIMLIEALIELHLQNIIHADIKSANIIYSLTNGTKCIKLVDFGASYFSSKETIDIECTSGTMGYTAPEQYRHKLNKKSDVYSLTATIIEFWNGDIWGNGNNYEDCRNELQRALRVIQNIYPNFGNVLSSGINELSVKRPTSLKFLHNVKKAFKHDHI
jgi:serine/threonine protein kinase